MAQTLDALCDYLERLNGRNVRRNAGAVPEAFSGTMDAAAYRKSVQYTLAKGRLGQIVSASANNLRNSPSRVRMRFSLGSPWSLTAYSTNTRSHWRLIRSRRARKTASSLPVAPMAADVRRDGARVFLLPVRNHLRVIGGDLVPEDVAAGAP